MTLFVWFQVASAAQQRIIVTYNPEARGAAEKIAEELSMNDLEVELRSGRKKDAEQASQEAGVSSVVFVDSGGATILMAEESRRPKESKAQEISRAPGESTDSLALRTSEHLRGRLLAGPGSEETPPRPRRSGIAPGQRFSFTTGPALLLRTFAAPAPGWGGDAAVWFGRWGVGPFLSGALTRGTWTATSDEVTFGQLRVGVGVRAIVLQSSQRRWEGQALIRAGLQPLSLRGTTGPEEDRFEGSALFFTGETGVEVTYRLSSWLKMGTQVVGGVDLNMKWPQTVEGKDLPEPAQGNSKEAQAPVPRAQGHFSPSVIWTAHF